MTKSNIENHVPIKIREYSGEYVDVTDTVNQLNITYNNVGIKEVQLVINATPRDITGVSLNGIFIPINNIRIIWSNPP